ncbi:MAG: SURF1 family protein [Sulfuritalea sp.]|jgi:surfeit locus 1 family protein|nr:SURF1 family protein [Sulfuritalea sp.]
MIATAAFCFHPQPRATLLLTVALPCLIGLGLWQLDRAHEREAAERLLEARMEMPAIVLPAVIVDAESLRERHVTAAGHYQPNRQFFLDNRVRHGQAGYEVITPLRLAGSDMTVLVNRGWVPAPADRRQLPVVATPEGIVAVDGIAVVPPPWTFSLARPGEGWEPVWQHLDLDRFQALTGMRLQPAVVRLSPQSAGGGFARDWPRADAGATRNLSYAVQWFGFAVAAVVLWIGSAVKRTPS